MEREQADIVERLRASCDVREAALLRNLSADEIEQLRALLRECQNVGMHTALWNRIDAALNDDHPPRESATGDQPSADALDAARYRWLRDSAGNDIMEKLMAECSPPRWDELVDAAIDAAMGERP